MATHVQVQDTINRCVSIIERYHDAERARRSPSQVIAEVRTIAVWLHELGMDVDEAEQRIVQPVRKRLIDRYGHELGSRLIVEFLKAFDSFLANDQRSLKSESPFGLFVA